MSNHLSPTGSHARPPHDALKKLKSRFISPLIGSPARTGAAPLYKARDSGVGLLEDDRAGGAAGTGMEERGDEGRAWNVLWRAPQAKKNKTWDDDGVLLIRPDGTSATLRNADGKVIASGAITCLISPGEEFKLGGKDVKIEDAMSYASYIDQFGAPPPTASSQLTQSRNATPARPLVAKALPVPPPRAQIPTPTPHLRNEGRRVEMEVENSPPARVESSGARKRGRQVEDSEEEEQIDDEEEKERQANRERKGKGREILKDEDEDVFMAPSTVVAVKADLEGWGEVESTEAEVERKRKKKEEIMRKVQEAKMRKGVELVPTKAVDEVVEESHYYLCQWRKQTTKKHPVWEGDGVLIIVGKKAILKDKETGKEIGTSRTTGDRFEPGDPVQVGGKIIEIESILPEKAYLDGTVFLKAPLGTPAPVYGTGLSAVLPSVVVKNFYLPVVTPKVMNKFSFAGPGSAGKVPKPRFDPELEGAIVLPRPSAEHEARYNKKGLTVVDVVIDPILAKSLRPHQVEGVKFMYECVMGMRTEGQGCILADEMGLGKTIQAITLIYTLLKQSPYFDKGIQTVLDRVVIVCPVTLVKNWKAEIKKWLGNDRLRVFVADGKSNIKQFTNSRSYNVLIIGYERLRTVIEDIKSVQPPVGLIICDEGHRLKSSGAKITKALKMLSTPRRIILSGTPIQNDLSELHSMVDFINPGSLDTYTVFKKVFETVILKSREPNATSKERKLGVARSDQLARVSKNFLLRRTGEVIQKYLPPKLEYTVFIVPTQLEVALYEKIIEGTAVKDLLSGAGKGHQLALLMVLRKLCNTPGLLMDQVKAGKGLEILNDSITSLFPDTSSSDFALSGKLLVLGSLLEALNTAGTEKIVVVSNFTSTLDIIGKHCKALKYSFCRLDGTTPAGDRIAMVDGFNRGPVKNNFIFLLSSKSGGTGLNIIGASRLVLVDSDWNPSTDAQAMARIHREGQKKPCVIYRFLTAGTMDEKIFQRQITKLGLSGSLMDSENTESGSGAKGDAFTNDDLRNIFKLHLGVSCQTHDLLGCHCHTDSATNSDAEEGSDDGEDEYLKLCEEGFQKASQYHPTNEDSTKSKKHLSLLNSWIHHDCTSETVVDDIEDLVLRGLVYTRIAETEKKEMGVRGVNGGVMLKGGRIGFAFARKSAMSEEVGE